MKKILTLFVLLLISVISFAQNPKLNFQAVVRDSENKLVVEQPVTVTVNVLDAANASQFEQTLNATTNRNGLMSLEIGDGTAAWNNINWNGAKIRTAVAFNGTEAVDTTVVNAMPFALYASGVNPKAIPQSDWAETDSDTCTFILNKPSIADTVNNILNDGLYVTTSEMNARISDTLSQYTQTTELCDVVNSCDLSDNVSLQNMLQELTNKISTTNSRIDTLSNRIDSIIPSMSVTTDSATHIGSASAMLHGTVTSLGDKTSVTAGFVYGTDANALTNNVAKSMSVTGEYNYTIQNLVRLTTYYYKAFETDGVDTVYGEVKNFVTPSFTCGIDSVADHEGNLYATVKIGTQCWTKQNMRCTTAPDGTVTLENGNGTVPPSTPYYFEPTGSMTVNGNTYTNEEYVEKFGRLYNYPGAMAINNQDTIFDYPHRGICPEGWHVPTNDEWHTMATFVYNNYKCPDCSDSIVGNYYHCIAKALTDSTDWDYDSDDCTVGNNLSANNATGFSALPAGYYDYEDYDNYVGYNTYFWSATPYNEEAAYELVLWNDEDYLVHSYNSRYYGDAVRCIQDMVFTDSASHITSSSATLHGTITSLGENASAAVGFQYGHTHNTMESTVTAGSVSETGPFSLDINGLDAATVYYRAFVVNGEDTVWGGVKYFTPITPMSVTTDSATQINHRSTTLHGTINGMSHPDATTAGFVYGTDENALTNNVAKSVSVTGEYDCRINNLSSHTTYYYKAFETDGTDTVYGEVKNFVTPSFICGSSSIDDHEGNLYTTVQIGTQCWTQQNMRCTTAPDGTVTLENGNGTYSSNNTPYYFEPTGSVTVNDTTYTKEEYVEKFGRLYNYPGTMAINNLDTIFDYPHRGICPEGWHMPTNDEWQTMATFVFNSTDPNYKCPGCDASIDGNSYPCIGKALADSTDWNYVSDNCAVGNDLSANNATGFSALPAGYYDCDEYGSFDFGINASFWSATPYNENSAFEWDILCFADNIYSPITSRSYGLSVRCIQNMVTTDSASHVTNSSATLHGAITSLGENASVTVGFQYGHTRNAMESTITAGSVSATGPFSFDIDGLDAATVYFKAFAANGGDTVWGEVKHFTPIAPMSVTTDSATAITKTSATLHGTINGMSHPDSTTAGFVYGTAENALTNTVSRRTSVTGDFCFDILDLETITTYYYKAFETDGVDTAYGEVKNFTTTSFVCGTDSVADHEGNFYATVKIGTQCWTKQNMRCTTAPDGTVTLTKGNGNSSTSTPYYYAPASDMTMNSVTYDSTDYVKKFGLLYNFPGAMAINNAATTLEPYHRGICPEGWHVPTDGEWTTMAAFIFNNTNPAYKCGGCSGEYGSGEFPCIAKALADSTDWNGDGSSCAIGNNKSNNNATGFSALPAGSYYNDINGLGVNAYFWSATPAIDERALEWHLFFDSDLLKGSVIKRHYGQSVRCVHDPLIVSTNNASPITYHSATLQGTAALFDENFDAVTVGFQYGTSESALNNKVSAGTIGESNTFSFDYSNLNSNTTYYFQAFATNGTDTLWGTVMNFTTADSISVTTNDTTHTTPTTVTLQGTLNELGGYASLTVGFQYGTSESAMNSRVAAGTMSTTGTFDYELTLAAATVYYQAFAANEKDTVLGDVKFFTPIAPMSVSTDSADNVSGSSATLYGTIHGMSNPNATTAGFVYGTAENALTNNVAKNMDITSDYNCPVQNLIPLTTYYYKAFETDGIDTVYGEVKDFTTTSLTCGIDSVADHEGNLYATVQIGSQCWTQQNMRCKSAPEGTVTLIKGNGTSSYSTPYYYEPTGSMTVNGTTYTKEEYVKKYGRLYNYPAAMAINIQDPIFDYPHRGICPEGWHMPTNDEWHTMATFVFNSTDPVYKCPDCTDSIEGNTYHCIAKALADSTDWITPSSTCNVGNNLSTNNATGFSALPAGYAEAGGFYSVGSYIYFWSATPDDGGEAYAWFLRYNYSYLYRNTSSLYFGNAVRCIQDIVITDSASHITSSSATLHGTITSLGENASVAVGFQYGHTRNAMESTVTVGNVTATGPFSLDIDGVDAATVYYRAFVVNGEDTVWGGVKYFTPITPMSVTTDSTTHIGGSSALLHGTIHGMSNPEATTAGFVYGTAENALTNNVAKSMSVTGEYDCRITNLSNLTTYYYKAFETDGIDTVYGEVKDFTTTSFTCGIDSVADHEGNLYATVQIGTQCWTQQNMRCTTAPDGTVTLENGYGDYSYSTPYYYAPAGSMTMNGTTYTKEAYVEKFGRLYNYPAAMAIDNMAITLEPYHRGICPEGWHVPTDEEWKTMATFVFNCTDPNYKCPNCTDSIEGDYYRCIGKALAAAADWYEYSSTCAVGLNLSANNATGFSALPTGYYYYYDYDDYGIYGAGSYANFWSATPYSEYSINSWGLYHDSDYLYHDHDSRYYGYSVRCLRDPMDVTTDSASPIIENSATLHGTVTNLGNYSTASVGFKYGTSDETMETTVTVGNVTATGPFSFDIEGLYLTTVYFKAFAANGEDTAWGEVKYITPISEMSVATDSATQINHRSAMLHGTLDGLSNPEATIAGFVYGTAENALTYTTMKSVSVTGGYDCHINNLSSHTTYYYKAFETDGVDTVYDEVLSFTTDSAFTCGVGSIDDHEGNLYTTVQIGTQCWTQQNMRCTTAPDGTVALKNGNGNYSTITPYYYEPTGSMMVNGTTYTKEEYVKKYGRLYNYPATMAIDKMAITFEPYHRGICPEGWHVPTNEEWKTMATFVFISTDPVYTCPDCKGSIYGGTYYCIAKALADSTDWDESSSTCVVGNDLSANNATGFSALPTGYTVSAGFSSVGSCAYFWSSTPYDGDYAYEWYLGYRYDYLYRDYDYRYYSEAVRCIQNMVTTDSASHVTSSSATLHGAITSLGENTSVAVGFQYGHTRNAMESIGTVGNVTATGPFSLDIDGVDTATVYFRAFAANGEDTVWGEVKYLTPMAPMSVTTDTATHIGKNSATLHGTINGLSNPEATTAGFVYGTAENALTKNIAKSVSVTGGYDCRITNLSNYTTYYYQAFETDGIDTVYGEVKDFTTTSHTCGIDSVADHEGNLYATVQIGSQCWTQQNMRCKSAPEGTVTLIKGNGTYSYSTPYYYEPTGSMTVNGTTYTKEEYVKKYGRLYNYPAAMAINNLGTVFDYPHRGICPEGWHVPTDEEWNTMGTFVFYSTDPNYKCPGCSGSINESYYYCIAKALADSTDWDESSSTCNVGNDLSTNNATGFSALPTGYADEDGFYTVGSYAYFWSATPYDGEVYEWYLDNSNNCLYRSTSHRYYGEAVRCIQNMVITDSASHITSNSATLHGTITSLGENASVAVGFQYGHTRNAMESSVIVGNVTATGPISFDIEGVDAATVYFRAFAINGEDTIWGGVKYFTPITPMSVTTDSTTDIGRSSAILHGTIHGMSNPEATTAGFVYGTAENALTKNIAKSVSVTGEYDCRITNLSNDTTYYYQAFETDGIDTVYGEVRSFTTASVFTCGIDSVADHEGNLYATVQIGTQCWTKQNMRCTTAPDGTVTLENGYGTYSYSTPYYYEPTYMKKDYGLLYNYPAAMAINNQDTIFDYPHRGICPKGWHMPTDEEWNTLGTFVFNSTDPNYKCPDCDGSIDGRSYYCIAKALADSTDWEYDSEDCDVGLNLSANNATGFSALPTGYYYYYDYDDYRVYGAGSYANFWSATPYNVNYVNSWNLYYYSNYLYHDYDSRYYGYSVRCIRDFAKLGVTTDSVSNVNAHTATLNGTVTEIDDELVSFAGFQYGHSERDMENRLVYGQMASLGSFSSEIDLLDASTVYYRAFVNNSEDIVWGEIKYFTPIADMSVVTNSATNIISSSATLHGTIHGFSNPDATIAGFVYGTDQNSLSSSVEISVSVTGNYSINTGGLTPSTTYYYQAFESDGEETVYGDILSFTTVESIEATTDSLQIVEGNIIKLHGAINYLGGHAAVAAGFKYGTRQDDLSTTVTVGTAITNTGAYSSKPILLIPDTTYYYQAFAAYEADTAWGIVKTYVSPMFQCGTSVVQDIDGNNYNTVQIGSQCWLKENLKTTNGLTKGTDYFYPANDAANVDDYGLHYTWNVANQNTSSTSSDVQGICPPGWHMPSDSDVYTLTKYVFDHYKCDDCGVSQWKEKTDCIASALASKYGWNTYSNTCAIGNNLSQNDTTGFSAMPAGNGPDNFHHSAYFWTSASNSNGYGCFFRMHADRHDVWIESSSKSSRYSVRCLYDRNN